MKLAKECNKITDWSLLIKKHLQNASLLTEWEALLRSCFLFGNSAKTSLAPVVLVSSSIKTFFWVCGSQSDLMAVANLLGWVFAMSMIIQRHLFAHCTGWYNSRQSQFEVLISQAWRRTKSLHVPLLGPAPWPLPFNEGSSTLLPVAGDAAGSVVGTIYNFACLLLYASAFTSSKLEGKIRWWLQVRPGTVEHRLGRD